MMWPRQSRQAGRPSGTTTREHALPEGEPLPDGIVKNADELLAYIKEQRRIKYEEGVHMFYDQVKEAADFIRQQISIGQEEQAAADTGLILGSGLGGLVDAMEGKQVISYRKCKFWCLGGRPRGESGLWPDRHPENCSYAGQIPLL